MCIAGYCLNVSFKYIAYTTGKISSTDNCRTIAANRVEMNMNTNRNQFRFKMKHGTNQCIYVLKDFID